MSEEKDIFYRRGEKKGMERGKVAFVKNLLLHTDFTIAKIAGLADVTEAFVKKGKEDLGNKHLLRRSRYVKPLFGAFFFDPPSFIYPHPSKVTICDLEKLHAI